VNLSKKGFARDLGVCKVCEIFCACVF